MAGRGARARGGGDVTDIGKQLEQARRSRGWSLRQAEHASGISNGYISQIEREEVEPSLDILLRLAKAYDIPFEVLLKSSGLIERRQESKESVIPPFIYSAAAQLDERDWQAVEAFVRALAAYHRGEVTEPRDAGQSDPRGLQLQC